MPLGTSAFTTFRCHVCMAFACMGEGRGRMQWEGVMGVGGQFH